MRITEKKIQFYHAVCLWPVVACCAAVDLRPLLESAVAILREGLPRTFPLKGSTRLAEMSPGLLAGPSQLQSGEPFPIGASRLALRSWDVFQCLLGTQQQRLRFLVSAQIH